MEMRERIEHEEYYRHSQNKFRNGDLSNFNEHTRRHLQRIQSPHIQPSESQRVMNLENATRANRHVQAILRLQLNLESVTRAGNRATHIH